eukprot:203207-Chlamydomonas_euryale.AAC.1
MASTSLGSASSTARRHAEHTAAMTCPEKGPYTSSRSSTLRRGASTLPSALPSMPSFALPGASASRACSSNATPHSGSSHSGPDPHAIWKPADTPDSTLERTCASTPAAPSPTLSAPPDAALPHMRPPRPSCAPARRSPTARSTQQRNSVVAPPSAPPPPP